MYVTRSLEPHLHTISQHFPVLWLTGARQVGKTTLLRQIKEPERTFVTLDDPLVRQLARDDPALFMQRFPPPVLIDEVQYAPELLPYVKMAVDEAGRPGLFWLTGSQQFRLMQGVSESLAGRVAIVNLAGLTLAEAHGKGGVAAPFVPTPSELQRRREVSTPLTLAQIYSIIWRGSLPAIALNPAVDHALFYGSYTQTYLQRDVRDLARVGDEAAFLRFLRATAARTGSLLNLSDLARDVDIAHNTARSWLSILESSGIVYLLEPFHTNLSKRLVKAPKLYFLDTGLAAYLTGWSSPKTLEAGAMSGAFFESWVVSELLKSFWHAARTPQLFYYRDRDQREIDVLFMQDGVTYPLEIKKTASPKPDDVRHFQTLERLGLRVGSGALICLATQSLPLGEKVEVVPGWML